MNILLDLFLTFAKIGLFTFGGGYAMISLIENSCVEKKRWITHDEMMNVTVIAESTPGPIAINCATFVGYKQKGLVGSIAATIGMVLPSFCIIFLISMFLDHFLEITWIAHAFMGIKIAVGILILDAAIKMIRKMQKKPIPLAIMMPKYKEKLETAQRRMEEAKAKMEKEKDAAQTATQEVTDLLSWADTFDEANAETKHMIIARLVERIEINHDYEVEIKFRISVEQYMRIAA